MKTLLVLASAMMMMVGLSPAASAEKKAAPTATTVQLKPVATKIGEGGLAGRQRWFQQRHQTTPGGKRLGSGPLAGSKHGLGIRPGGR